MTWRDSAACIDSALDWMVDTPTSAHEACCAACPVRGDCLTYALTTRPLVAGIWAGTSETDRRRLRRKPA